MNTLRTKKTLGNGKIEHIIDVGTPVGARSETLTSDRELTQTEIDAVIKEIDDLKAAEVEKEKKEAEAIRQSYMSAEEKEHLGIT